MKKRVCIILLLISVASICFAQTAKYRYASVTEKCVMICDFKEEFTDEKLKNPFIIPLNTKLERLPAESTFRNFQSLFYSDILFVYADFTKNVNDPDFLYIDSWSDVIEYVRGTK